MDVRSLRVTPFVAFVLLTFLLGGALWVLYFTFGGSWQDPSSSILRLAYGWTPLLAALLLRRSYPFPDEERVSVRWLLLAWLLPVLLLLGAVALAIALPSLTFSTETNEVIARLSQTLSAQDVQTVRAQFDQYALHPFWIGLAEGLLLGGTLYAVFYLGEEVGWRGFLFRSLQSHGFWTASLVTGFVWGCWLVPLAFFQNATGSNPLLAIPLTFAWAIAASPILQCLRTRTHSSFAPAVFRGTMEALLPLPLLAVSSTNLLLIGGKGIAGIAVLLLADCVLLLRRPTCPPAPPTPRFQKRKKKPTRT